MGVCYQYEKGVEKNNIKALEWYEKSAEEYSDAQLMLGECYQYKYFEKSAKQGDSDA